MRLTITICLFCFLLLKAQAQQVQTDSLGFETFSYEAEDTVYQMKKYFIVFLERGDKREQSEEEAARIQKEHMAHINWMAGQGYLDMAGPFADDGNIRGILIMRVPSLERAEELANMDPAVKAGRLKVTIHPWWASVGSCLK